MRERRKDETCFGIKMFHSVLSLKTESAEHTLGTSRGNRIRQITKEMSAGNSKHIRTCLWSTEKKMQEVTVHRCRTILWKRFSGLLCTISYKKYRPRSCHLPISLQKIFYTFLYCGFYWIDGKAWEKRKMPELWANHFQKYPQKLLCCGPSPICNQTISFSTCPIYLTINIWKQYKASQCISFLITKMVQFTK